MQVHATGWMILENSTLVLGERSHTPEVTCCMVPCVGDTQKCKSIELEHRLVAGGWWPGAGEREGWGANASWVQGFRLERGKCVGTK